MSGRTAVSIYAEIFLLCIETRADTEKADSSVSDLKGLYSGQMASGQERMEGA